MFYLGMQAYTFFDEYKARLYFEASVKSLQKAGLISGMVESLSFLSIVLGHLGERSSALKTAQEAADLSKETGDKQLQAISMRRLALVYLLKHNYSEALPIAEAAHKVFHEMGDFYNELYALNTLGYINERLERTAVAESDFLDGLSIAESISDENGIISLINGLSFLNNWNLGEYTKTMELLENQEGKARQSENEFFEIELQMRKVNELVRQGSLEPAFSIGETSLPYFKEGDEVRHAWVLRRMAMLSAELGRFDQAHRYLDEADELRSKIQNPIEQAYLDHAAARVSLLAGETSNLLVGMDKANNAITLLREKADKAELG